VQAAFVAVLGRLRHHAEVCFRHVKCPGRRADLVAESLALAWAWFLGLVARGKDVSGFVSRLADYAVRHARCGRRLCGMERAKDALSPRAQTRRGFLVQTLPRCDSGGDNPALDALIDNTRTPPDEQAIFRIDFPAWLSSLGERDRTIALEMMRGDGTLELASRHGRSPGRISQLRGELRASWRRFTGQEPEPEPTHQFHGHLAR
jgi:hypothetical protein